MISTIFRRFRMSVVKPFGRRLPPGLLRVSLCDTRPEVAHALAVGFAGVDGVEVLEGSLLDLDADAVVSPANSFGDMGGGVDQAIDHHYGGEAQRRVMAEIAGRFCGELPVGMALVIPMPARRFPFLISAPTMRVPGDVRGTINAYLAMRAAFVAIVRHNAEAAGPGPIRSVAVPGLGTGVGAMAPEVAARQMRAAHDNIIGGGWRKIVHPAFAPFALDRL